MESIISTFHLDWKLMLAQLFNFGVVVFVLWYFVFRPLSTKMGERTKTIEKSLAEAKLIAENLKSAEKEKEEIIRFARQKADKIMVETAELTKQEREKTVNTTKAEVKKIVEDGKAQIATEKEKMLSEVKSEVADLVVAATTKVLEKVTDAKINRELIKEAMQTAKKK